jgi:hypothetical protein
VFSQITFFAYNFDRMVLFIHKDLFEAEEKEMPHTGVNLPHIQWVPGLSRG